MDDGRDPERHEAVDAPVGDAAHRAGPSPDDAPFERPVDRFRTTAVGTVVAAGLLGLAQALEGRPPREEVAIVQEAPTRPVVTPREMELLLDREHPERSMVFLPDATAPDAIAPDPPGTPGRSA